jgi:phosphoenolpyruvate carboxykinase (GTP)
MQFSLYVDKIIDRIDLQRDAYSREQDIPATLYEVYARQRKELLALKEQFGPVVNVDNL